ncbi:uncharacterized protein LOC128268982 [Anopheles cruzii]|uniref:uncharacterized protein LOC128268982 n=1 Tax=Anopheles cruzii TaxID=68878 RepID=UPI0022EC1972|nr:uncharacterized protein LOC128268982 [Anopheles cruzii]
MSALKQLLVLLGMVALVAAQELVDANTRTVEERGRRKRFYKFFLKALGPVLSTLTTVVLVKAKLVFVGLIIAGIYFFGHKILPGHFFGSSIISETPPPFIDAGGFTDYHAHHHGHEIISSYPGPEPFSGYGSEPFSSYGPPPSGGASSYSSSSTYTAPGTRRKRDIADEEQPIDDAEDELGPDEMYWTDTITDMAFRLLGVNRRACQKRFVCEFDFQARRNPLLLFMTRIVGRDIFHNYRDASDERAQTYRDCGRIHEECKVPQRRKNVRRPPARVPVVEQPSEQMDQPQSESYSYDTQENEVGDSESTTTAPTVSPLRGKLILKRVNRFRRN